MVCVSDELFSSPLWTLFAWSSASAFNLALRRPLLPAPDGSTHDMDSLKGDVNVQALRSNTQPEGGSAKRSKHVSTHHSPTYSKRQRPVASNTSGMPLTVLTREQSGVVLPNSMLTRLVASCLH